MLCRSPQLNGRAVTLVAQGDTLTEDKLLCDAKTSDREKIRQAIYACANDLPNHREPGVLFIGVHDEGGCANLPILLG
jgi:hypothetical protein